jgi:radical SAM-linked protein
MHRLRLKFSRGNKLKFLSHLDLMRLWERALRRAGMTPAYSEGFSPHPKISLAAPLPVGVTSSAEMMDVFLGTRVTPGHFVQKVVPQLPEGIAIVDISPVGIQLPSLQSRVRLAEYVVEIRTEKSGTEVEAELSVMKSREQLSWHHSRDTGEKYYDLRALIDDLWLAGEIENGCKIGMRLRCGPLGSGRPEQVIKALGFEEVPESIERTKLIFE